MPRENAAGPLAATRCRPTRSSTSSTRGARDAVGLREREQVVVGRASGVHGLGVEQRADLVQRRGEVGGSAGR